MSSRATSRCPACRAYSLEQVEQDALEGRWVGALPALTRPPHVAQLVRPHNRGGNAPLPLQSTHQIRRVLGVGDVPATVLRISPGLRDRLAFKPPHEPAPLDVRQVLHELEDRPARGQHTRSELIV